jgi:acetyltransferase-like isoleucine patch superfamily enzyme
MTRFVRFAINKIYTICNKTMGLKAHRGSMIHCSSEIRSKRNVTIGRKSILYKRQSIYLNRSGKFVMGQLSHVAPYGYFLIEDRSIIIGDDVAIGPFCSFFCSSNSYSPDKPLFRENYEKGDIRIGNNVFIGAQSVILPDTIIHDDVIIAANSVVKGTLDSGWMYGGSPCKPIKKLNKND